MTRSMFGWSLPPGVTRLPGEEPDQAEMQLHHRCKLCGGFLRSKSDRTEPWEDADLCDGSVKVMEGEFISTCGFQTSLEPHKPHKEIRMAGSHLFFNCRNCGHVTKTSDV